MLQVAVETQAAKQSMQTTVLKKKNNYSNTFIYIPPLKTGSTKCFVRHNRQNTQGIHTDKTKEKKKKHHIKTKKLLI